MDVWGWGSPIAWALFLVGCGATAVLVGWTLQLVSVASERFMALSPKKKK